MKKNVVGFFKDNKLLTGLYFVFVFLLFTTTYVGFSGNVEGNAVKVSSITPEYDESSSVVVNNNDVVFNDRDQEVKYKVVLENTQGTDLYVSAINQTTPIESFLSYKVENLKKDDAIKGNSKKEIIVSLKTNAVEGWGRNFEDELTANVSFAKKVVSNNQNVGSPDTGDGIVLAVLIAVTSATGLAILIVSKNKFAKYMVFVLMLTPALTLVKADTTIQLPITINASFESQNVMKPSGVSEGMPADYWNYAGLIKNFYILNELTAIPGYIEENFDVSNEGNGRVKAYLVKNVVDSSMYDLYLQADGVIYPNTNASYYFSDMEYLDKIVNIDGLDVSNVTNMNSMFKLAGCNSEVFALDLGDKFDTSSVTDMGRMFDSAGANNSVFTLDLGSNFDTSKVTGMNGMFNGVGENNSQFTLDLGDKFDTSNVTDMSSMFNGVGAGSEVFTLDLGDKFDTRNVTDMNSMFANLGRSNTNFTLDLGDKFDTSNVTDMNGMFDSFAMNTSSFILNLGDKFDTSKVTGMNGMFNSTGRDATGFKAIITIRNSSLSSFSYMSMFTNSVNGNDSQIIVNYTSETEALVEQMIATKSPESNVVKGHLIVDADNLSVGDEIHISGEKFNVVSQDDDTVTMLAKYNLGTDYRQSTVNNSMTLSEDFTWRENSNEIDVQSLTSGLKTYVNNYVAYLKDALEVEDIFGNLISLNELNNLECDVNIEEPLDVNNCFNSQHSEWLVNGQNWYTRIRYPEMYDKVFVVGADSYINAVSTDNPSGLRPTITISKETLRNLG